MTYEQTTDWLFNQLPMYQKVGKTAYKADLSNTIKLAKHLGNPETKFKSLHVAGTNGKGSTSHMLASILQDAGYRVGLYTSPHLKDFRERIKINGEMVSKDFVIDFVANNQSFFNENHFSFFEMTVGMAFEFFSKKQVDIAVVEVGMGGRLDSTNIISPEVSVITNIGLDHTQFLGNTLGEIAFEKGGVIKPNTPCVIGSSSKETKSVFKEIAEDRGSDLYFAEDNDPCQFNTDLLGSYQKENSTTALQAIKLLQKQNWSISENSIISGFKNVVKNTDLRGRWQELNNKPLTVCDTAHNIEGLQYVLKQIEEQDFEQLHIVLGFVADKKIEQILPLFPKNATYYFTKPNNQRAFSEITLQEKAVDFKLKGDVYVSVKEAFMEAKSQASLNDMIYVGGSTFVVAEIL